MALRLSLELMKDLRNKIEFDLKQSKEYDLESAMWKSCVQVAIREFRKRLKAEKGKRTYSETLKSFHNFVREYMNVYRSMLSFATTNRKKRRRDDDVKDSLYRYNIFLGDLARYKELHSLNRSKIFKEAIQYYKKARSILPYRGMPYNQLAVIASYESKSLDALYFYIRALCCKIPFPNAKENMNQFVGVVLKNRSRYLVKDRHAKLDAMLLSGGGEGDIVVRKKLSKSAETSITTFHASILSLDSPPRDGNMWNLLFSGALGSVRFLLNRKLISMESSVRLLVTCVYSSRHAASERAKEYAARFLMEFMNLLLLKLRDNDDDELSLSTIRVFCDWCCRGDLSDPVRSFVCTHPFALKFWTKLCEMVNEVVINEEKETNYRFASPEHLILQGYSLIDTSNFEEMSETSCGGREKRVVLKAQRWYAIRLNIERIADGSESCCVYPIQDDLMLTFTTDRELYFASLEKDEDEEEDNDEDDEEIIVFSPESRRRRQHEPPPPAVVVEEDKDKKSQKQKDAMLSLIEKLRLSSRKDYNLFM
jgi:hypothetical protein